MGQRTLNRWSQTWRWRRRKATVKMATRKMTRKMAMKMMKRTMRTMRRRRMTRRVRRRLRWFAKISGVRLNKSDAVDSAGCLTTSHPNKVVARADVGHERARSYGKIITRAAWQRLCARKIRAAGLWDRDSLLAPLGFAPWGVFSFAFSSSFLGFCYFWVFLILSMVRAPLAGWRGCVHPETHFTQHVFALRVFQLSPACGHAPPLLAFVTVSPVMRLRQAALPFAFASG